MTNALARAARVAGAGAGGAALLWLGWTAAAWRRYGRASRRGAPDPLLDRFLPTYEVRERHEVRIAAPADVTYAAAYDLDLMRSRAVRAIFRGRELLMGASRGEAPTGAPRSLLEQTLALGWGVLAERPGREIVVGSVTQPWVADVRFRAIPPGEFAAFSEPGWTKIAWTLAAVPFGPGASLFRTETRVATTDADARARFRRYWAVVSPGVVLIRRLGLRLVKREAERRARRRLAPIMRAPQEGVAPAR